VNAWTWTYHGFVPDQERLREALCTLGNGYFATRGAAPEACADGVHYPGTYLAGGYNRAKIIARALELPQHLPAERWEELMEQLGIAEEELSHWDQVSRNMRLCFHGDGIISQFEGFERLAELDWDAYRHRYGDIHRLDRILESEDDSANRYQACKQADVLMLFYLFSREQLERLFARLGYSFSADVIRRTIAYYLPRTSHGSTLSRVTTAWVLARSDRPRSWTLFTEALDSDVQDIQGGTTAEGIHLGAMAGTADLIQRCYTGIEIRDRHLWINPALPDELSCLRVRLRFRGQSVAIEITHELARLRAISPGKEPIRVRIDGETHTLAADETLEVRLERTPVFVDSP
jgi:trehalose/maltose hydrolase-like predicted phosphorylase